MTSQRMEIKMESSTAQIITRNLDFSYGDKKVLHNITMEIPEKKVTAFIGPSGCGKTTFLRCLNRMNDLVKNAHHSGEILVEGKNIFDADVDVVLLRKQVGMVFQKSNPFPKTVYENVAYGPRVNGVSRHYELDKVVERSLRQAALWDEVKDRLQDSALGLSGGQQQRLCIARTLAVEPRIILMDEPASALDPISTAKIEDLIAELKNRYTIIIVTHNMQQAARVSDITAFFLLGELVEMDQTQKIFTDPSKKTTEDYITGRFG